MNQKKNRNTNNRRTFLKQATAAAGALSLGILPFSSCSSRKEVPWRYAMCNESMMDRSWAEQCQIIGNAGYNAVEIASFTLVENSVEELTGADRQQLVRDMKNAGIECIGLHWLLSPPPEGLHFTTPDQEVRERTINYLHTLIDFCRDMGGNVMIFGSPNQRSTTQGASIEEAKNNFSDGIARVADHAEENGIKILIEPLGSEQTDVINTMAEAMEIVNHINHPAIQTMFDFHNTPDETESHHVLIEKYFDHIYHVHVQEMDGSYLGAGNAVNDYVKAFQTLKDLGYNKYVSLEVFDFNPGGEKIANVSMQTLKKIEDKLS